MGIEEIKEEMKNYSYLIGNQYANGSFKRKVVEKLEYS